MFFLPTKVLRILLPCWKIVIDIYKAKPITTLLYYPGKNHQAPLLLPRSISLFHTG